MQTIARKKSTHTTTENYQITKVERKKKQGYYKTRKQLTK